MTKSGDFQETSAFIIEVVCVAAKKMSVFFSPPPAVGKHVYLPLQN